MSTSKETWRVVAERYQTQAADSRKGPAAQLARMVIADYCARMWNGSQGGPSLAMVALAEHILGESVDEVIAAELAKDIEAKKEILS